MSRFRHAYTTFDTRSYGDYRDAIAEIADSIDAHGAVRGVATGPLASSGTARDAESGKNYCLRCGLLFEAHCRQCHFTCEICRPDFTHAESCQSAAARQEREEAAARAEKAAGKKKAPEPKPSPAYDRGRAAASIFLKRCWNPWDLL